MHPIEIGRITEDEKFIVDNDLLIELFDSHKDKELYIVSLAGSYRTGKSFMLNFFIRYLRERGWENSDWFGPDEKRLHDGFDWQRGADPHTKGILVWPEVFDVPLRNGKQASVMLVDTQGLFDNDNTPDTNAKILSISALLSSHQILNIQNRIEERDLEHLQLSVAYACAAVGLQSNKDERRKQTTTFQRLTFLIRDWVNDNEYSYGEGGNAYLDSILRKKSKSESVNEVKQSVHRAFEGVRGFLMPEPGKTVKKGDKNNLVNGDIDSEFREYTIELTEAVLHPRNLIRKKMFGKAVSSRELRDLIAAVSNSFKHGKLPEIDTMLKNTVQANNNHAAQQAVQRYREKINEDIKDEAIGDEDLEKFHDEALLEATKKFHEVSMLGGEKEKRDALEQALKECEDYHKMVIDGNETKKSETIEKMNNLTLELETRYKKTMKNHDLSAMKKDKLRSESDSMCKIILQEFKEKTNDWKKVLSTKVKEKHLNLKESLLSHYELLERERENHEKSAKMDQEMKELRINQIENGIFSELQRAMNKYQDQYCLDIEKNFKNESKKSLEKYDRETRSFDQRKIVQDARDKLRNDMNDYFTDFLQGNNEKNKGQLGLKYGQDIEAALGDYDLYMKQINAGGKWLPHEEFNKKHQEIKSNVMKDFDQKIKNISPALPPENVSQYRTKLSDKMDMNCNAIYNQMNDQNKHLHEEKENMKNSKAAGFVDDALRCYEAEMNKILNNGASCDNLATQHENFKKLAKGKFENLCKGAGISCDVSDRLTTLNQLMDNMFQTYKNMNENNKEASVDKQKREYFPKAVNSYECNMREYVSGNTSLDENDLETKHAEFKRNAINDFAENMKSNVKTEDEDGLKKRIEEIYTNFKIQNSNLKESEKIKAQNHATGKTQIGIAKTAAYNSFVSRIGEYAQDYVINLDQVCEAEKNTALVMFDQLTNTQKTEEDLASDVENEKEELVQMIDAHFEKVQETNDENKDRMVMQEDNAVKMLVNEYHSELNEILSTVHASDASIDRCEKEFIEKLPERLIEFPGSVIAQATREIKQKTALVKKQNKENRKTRSAESDSCHVM